jgi:CRISPR-associated protein Cmr3
MRLKIMSELFKYLIQVNPLGLLYGSSGAFLSPENLVGRSGAKFPPDPATLSGLFFSVNKIKKMFDPKELSKELFIAGPFWADVRNIDNIYVPIPWTKVIGESNYNEWKLRNGENYQWEKPENKPGEKIEPYYTWLPITEWNKEARVISSNKSAKVPPWKFTPILHPQMKSDERSVVEKDGLFLENAVEMSPENCLVYLSSYPLEEGWYKFGGENHLVEIKSKRIKPDDKLYKLLYKEKIENTFALITPGVWGSTHLSYRYPQHPTFPKVPKMLTDKPIPYRYSAGGRLGRGRYAVPPGTVYVLEEPLNQSWSEWPEDWFPQEGFSLKKLGCGLSLPLTIK